MGSWQNPGIKIPGPHTCHTEVRRAFNQVIQKFGLSSANMKFGTPIPTAIALRFLATDASKSPVTIKLSDRLSGTANQVILTDNSDGTFTLSLPQDIHAGASPTLAGATFTGFTGVLKAVAGVLTGNADHADLANITTDQHHAKSHAHNGGDGSGTVAHSDSTGKTIDDHHAKSHTHDGVDGSGTVAHGDTTGKGTDDHHAQGHTIVSHDTAATGAQLTTLTDSSNADSLHKHTLVALTETHVAPNSMTVTTGTLTAGTVADAQSWQDTNAVEITEVTGVPGFEVRFTFTSVTDFCRVGHSSYYTGSISGHYACFQIYDHTNTAWKTLHTFRDMDDYNYRFSDLPVSAATRLADYVSGSNEVWVRYYHPGTGNASHKLWIDYVGLVS
jgi:hypothetical protein